MPVLQVQTVEKSLIDLFFVIRSVEEGIYPYEV